MIKADSKFGYLCLNSWSGRSETLVEIVGETEKNYRIKALTQMKLAGRNKWLDVGEIALAPKYSIKFKESNND